MKHVKVIASIFVSLFLIIGCQQEGDINPASFSIDNELSRSENARPKTMVWSDGRLYESVVTPAVFDGDKGNYDRLYAASFYDGIGLISESKPGDQDYNGGRWDLHLLKVGVDPDKYNMATSDQDLDLNDFESADTYFECPLLPRKGNK